MSDLISRQAAIDAIFNDKIDSNSLEIMTALGNGNEALTVNMTCDRHMLLLSKLPSAQPEIIRCKECKHFHYDMPYVIQGVPVLGHEVCDAWGDGCKTDENGYCFLAERSTNE